MKKEHEFTDKKQDNELIEDVETASENETEVETAAKKPDELALVKEENKKLKEDFLRALADSENVKKRCAAEIEKNNKYAVTSFAKDLLGVADNLQRALSAAENTENADFAALLKGVELTQNELNHVFAKFGIEQMHAMGTVFDPNYHRVVQEVEDADKPAGTVIAELQTGYLINGRILREAMVVVSKGGK